MRIIEFVRARLNSFLPAIEGLVFTIKTEKNTWIHLIATVVAILAIFLFNLTYIDALFIISAIFLVWICELFNTSIEYIMDFIQLEKNPKIKTIKDISAAGVFLSSIYAILVAAVIIIGKIIN